MQNINAKTKLQLAKAAEAAGLEIKYWMDACPMVTSVKLSAQNDEPWSWNPLTNDGDAFRLMVQLSININASRILESPGCPYKAVREAVVAKAAGLARSRVAA